MKKTILIILSIILISGVGFVSFNYSNITDKLNGKEAERERLEAEYELLQKKAEHEKQVNEQHIKYLESL